MRFTYSTTVRNSIENVWDFIMDFERRPAWIHFYDKSFITHKTDSWVGTRYKDKLTFLGIPLFIEYKIVEYEHHHLWKSVCKMPPFYPVVEVRAFDNKDGTINSSLVFDIELKGPFRFIPRSLITTQVDDIILPCMDKYVELNDLG